MTLLDQLLLPARLLGRALEDVHRIADAAVSLGTLALDVAGEVESLNQWMRTTASDLELLRKHAAGVQAAIEPMVDEVRVLRDEFGRANDEIARLGDTFAPQLAGLRSSANGMLEEIGRLRELLTGLDGDIREMGGQVTTEMHALDASVRALVRDADEISDVVEPLQTATERVGRVADRLPGGSRRRS